MGEAVSELSRETWDAMMTLNAWSFIALSRAVVPHMRVRGGAIVAVSARAAARGEANMAAYCAAKSALQRLVESLSAEVREHGIRVNSVAPSIIDTPANRQAMPDADPSRWVSREGLAGTLAFLLSDAARDIHGTHLVVSGLC
jgi:NAD(P)-dependent dehydrogenase (short-subunit alcohol dehydrogenase family)